MWLRLSDWPGEVFRSQYLECQLLFLCTWISHATHSRRLTLSYLLNSVITQLSVDHHWIWKWVHRVGLFYVGDAHRLCASQDVSWSTVVPRRNYWPLFAYSGIPPMECFKKHNYYSHILQCTDFLHLSKFSLKFASCFPPYTRNDANVIWVVSTCQRKHGIFLLIFSPYHCLFGF